MKKSLVLGAAALATMMFAAPQAADASEFSFGGGYMFRMQSAQTSVATTEADDQERWVQRLQWNMNWKQDDKTHAHTVIRVLDSSTVEGADYKVGGDWQLRTVWLETEMYGLGVKVGSMPLSLNDNILLSNKDTTGFATAMLTKSFGNTTLLLADVRANEGGVTNDDDDIDVYTISVLGDAGTINYNVTGAYQDDSADAAADNDNFWFAATVGADLGAINLTATGIYEDGLDVANTDTDGYILALRLKGEAGGGMGWNAYGFYASEDFDTIQDNDMVWSKTWDMGGTGGTDLLKIWSASTAATAATADTAATAAYGLKGSTSKNMMGIGAGVTIKAADWTINPMLDYAARVEDDTDNSGDSDFATDSAWGGALALSHKINKATTFGITGVFVEPSNDNLDTDTMHYLETNLKMKF